MCVCVWGGCAYVCMSVCVYICILQSTMNIICNDWRNLKKLLFFKLNILRETCEWENESKDNTQEEPECHWPVHGKTWTPFLLEAEEAGGRDWESLGWRKFLK